MTRGISGLLCVAVCMAALALSACGSSSPKSSTPGTSGGSAKATSIDVGNGTVKLAGDPMQLALFLGGTNNSYLQSALAGARDEARKVGASLTVFDAKFDPTAQFNQIQNALQSHRFNAFIVQPLDGNLMCNVSTKTAPSQGILVTAIALQLCGRDLADGAAQWAPGTYQFVGGAFSHQTFAAWLAEISKRNPGPQKVGVLTGPTLNPLTKSFYQGLREAILDKRSDFKVVARADTDYSVPVGEQKAQNMLQAHPDLTLIIADYTALTQGVITALKQAGKQPGDIKVVDAGGTEFSKQAIEDGWVELTIPQYPRTNSVVAIDGLAAAFAGRPGPHYVGNDGAPAPKSGLIDVFDKSNVGTLVPESK